VQPRSINKQSLYKDLSWLWPVVSPPGDYIQESLAFARLLQGSSSHPVRTLLNLGCGGGSNDFTLKRFFAITGVDLSPNMLELARKLNPNVSYLEGDMRSIRLGHTFDAVACFDAIAYMLTPTDLLAAFRTAAAHLEPGGLLITFVEETPETFEQNRTVLSTHVAGSIEAAVVENTYDPDPRDTTFDLTFVFLVRRCGHLKTYLDQHTCGLFPMSTWTECLMQAGLEPMGTHYSAGLVTPDGRRLPILLAKKKTS